MALFSPFVVNQWDPDAGAFINAALINGTNEAFAINQLVEQLKGVGLWNLMNVIYPFVGGTAFTNKWNLKNPQDTDAAYRMTFGGTMTFDSNGITGNGTNAFGDTKIKPANIGGGQNNSFFSYYMKNITASNGTDFGCQNAGGVFYVNNARNASNICRAYHNTTGFGDVAFSGTSGLFTINRTTSTTWSTTINKTTTNFTTASTTPPDFNCYIMAYNNNGTAANFRTRTCGLLTAGYSLTATQISNLADINQTFQQTLGRFA